MSLLRIPLLSCFALALGSVTPALSGMEAPPPPPPTHGLALSPGQPMTVPGTRCRIRLDGYRRRPCPSGVQCVHAGTETLSFLVDGPAGTRARIETTRIIGQRRFPSPLNALGLQLWVRDLKSRPLQVLVDVRPVPGIPPCGGPPR